MSELQNLVNSSLEVSSPPEATKYSNKEAETRVREGLACARQKEGRHTKEKSVYVMVPNMGAIRLPTGSDDIQHKGGGDSRARMLWFII